MLKIKRALVSVFAKGGIVEFARGLEKFRIEIISTGATASLLKQRGISVKSVAEYTGEEELLSGRVKTLHPKIHAGILARRDEPQQIKELKSKNIPFLDMVVCNFYPFEKVISGHRLNEVLENIDIGGPTMVRAAAKNYPGVAVLTAPEQYAEVLEELEKNKGRLNLATCKELAQTAWRKIAYYDNIIAEYFNKSDELFPQYQRIRLEKVQSLRYGENPHQKAALYRGQRAKGREQIKQLHGKELSYNNLVDLDGAQGLLAEFEERTAVIVKHTSPCGVAVNKKLVEAYKNAFACDPVSAFGSIVGFNREVDLTTAKEISKTFVECVIAPKFSKQALDILKQKKNIRLIQLPNHLSTQSPNGDYKKVFRDFVLVQEKDIKSFTGLKTVTKRKPAANELQALKFAWRVCKWVKSNAIVFTTRDRTLGIGVGQPSRVDSVKFAAQKMQFFRLTPDALRLTPLVMASDAFFPFRDGIDEAARAGVTAVIQPGGSIRDQEVIAACNEHRIAMIFTGLRHFRH